MENISKTIEQFLCLLDRAPIEYDDNLEELQVQDKLTQDYLHKLELEKIPYKERCKIATSLVQNRKDRRYFKDRVEELEPIIDMLNSREQDFRPFIRKLKEVLGQVRKQETYHSNRFYVPKVLRQAHGESEVVVDDKTV